MAYTLSQKKHKKSSLLNFLNFLEDPRYPSVGPHLRLLSLTGQWHPDLNTPIAKFKQYLFYITVTFFVSQYLKCCFKLKISYLLLILQYAPFHMGIVKSCFFQKDYKKWESIVDYITEVEQKQISSGDGKINRILKAYITRGRRVTYFFWALAILSNFSIFSEPYQKNQIVENGTSVYLKIFDGYMPFESDEPPGYYISMGIQTVLGHIVSAYVVGWDTLICTMMIFFAGQLKITRLICSRVVNARNPEQSHRNIAECHRFYVSLVK
jgi:hypothetical protein